MISYLEKEITQHTHAHSLNLTKKKLNHKKIGITQIDRIINFLSINEKLQKSGVKNDETKVDKHENSKLLISKVCKQQKIT